MLRRFSHLRPGWAQLSVADPSQHPTGLLRAASAAWFPGVTGSSGREELQLKVCFHPQRLAGICQQLAGAHGAQPRDPCPAVSFRASGLEHQAPLASLGISPASAGPAFGCHTHLPQVEVPPLLRAIHRHKIQAGRTHETKQNETEHSLSWPCRAPGHPSAHLPPSLPQTSGNTVLFPLAPLHLLPTQSGFHTRHPEKSFCHWPTVSDQELRARRAARRRRRRQGAVGRPPGPSWAS